MTRPELLALIASNLYAGDRARNLRGVSLIGCLQRAAELVIQAERRLLEDGSIDPGTYREWKAEEKKCA